MFKIKKSLDLTLNSNQLKFKMLPSNNEIGIYTIT